MILIRSLLFVALFYLWSAVVAIAMLPLLLAPRRMTMRAMHLWTRGVVGMLRAVCAVRVEFRGLNHLPAGGALIGAKHQCMFDTIAPVEVFADPCYVMKKELMRIPFYGWFSAKAAMIVVDREGQASALRKLVSEGRASLAQARQLVIFPEGSRTAPGTTGVYHPGVAGLYKALAVPCTPLATNSGAHWPAHGFLRHPGLIVYEFLEPIAPGLRREAFMNLLRERIEAASRSLLRE